MAQRPEIGETDPPIDGIESDCPDSQETAGYLVHGKSSSAGSPFARSGLTVFGARATLAVVVGGSRH